MKKTALIIGLFLLPFVSFAATFDTNLKVGMTSPDVANLQDFLSSEGCFSLQPTGYFGLITFASVKCFQAKHGLPVTGFFGPLSRGEANQIFAEAVSSSDQAEVVEIGTTTPVIQPTVQQNAIPVQNPIPSTNQSFGGIIEQPIIVMQPTCTLATPSNVGAPSSFVDVTWTTTNATSVKIHNNHVSDGLDAYGYPLALNGTRKVQLSSEAGENNILTLVVSGPNGDTSCTASVLTQ